MIQLLADALTVAGLLMGYIAVAVLASIAGTAALLKIRELWKR